MHATHLVNLTCISTKYHQKLSKVIEVKQHTRFCLEKSMKRKFKLVERKKIKKHELSFLHAIRLQDLKTINKRVMMALDCSPELDLGYFYF